LLVLEISAETLPGMVNFKSKYFIESVMFQMSEISGSEKAGVEFCCD
jgi:hypothetical protein